MPLSSAISDTEDVLVMRCALGGCLHKHTLFGYSNMYFMLSIISTLEFFLPRSKENDGMEGFRKLIVLRIERGLISECFSSKFSLYPPYSSVKNEVEPERHCRVIFQIIA